jgi:hypothetical protein
MGSPPPVGRVDDELTVERRRIRRDEVLNGHAGHGEHDRMDAVGVGGRT